MPEEKKTLLSPLQKALLELEEMLLYIWDNKPTPEQIDEQ